MKDYGNIKTARLEALRLSKANPQNYYTFFACFGVFIDCQKRLHIFAPSDSCYPYYFKNGQEKPFTEAQRIADQNATPLMA